MTCRREHLRRSDIPGCVELSAEFIGEMLFGTGVTKEAKPKTIKVSKPVKARKTNWKAKK
jgi:hypothetical protein